MTAPSMTPAAAFLASQDSEMFDFNEAPGNSNSTDTDTTAGTPAGSMQTFTGVLTRNPELRTTTAADGLHSTPIITLELRALHAHDKRTCLAQIPFTDATRPAAECWAKTHKKGTVITVACDPLYTRLMLPQAHIINSYTPK